MEIFFILSSIFSYKILNNPNLDTKDLDHEASKTIVNSSEKIINEDSTLPKTTKLSSVSESKEKSLVPKTTKTNSELKKNENTIPIQITTPNANSTSSSHKTNTTDISSARKINENSSAHQKSEKCHSNSTKINKTSSLCKANKKSSVPENKENSLETKKTETSLESKTTQKKGPKPKPVKEISNSLNTNFSSSARKNTEKSSVPHIKHNSTNSSNTTSNSSSNTTGNATGNATSNTTSNATDNATTNATCNNYSKVFDQVDIYQSNFDCPKGQIWDQYAGQCVDKSCNVTDYLNINYTFINNVMLPLNATTPEIYPNLSKYQYRTVSKNLK